MPEKRTNIRTNKPPKNGEWRVIQPGDASPTDIPITQIPLTGEPEVVDTANTPEEVVDERKELEEKE